MTKDTVYQVTHIEDIEIEMLAYYEDMEEENTSDIFLNISPVDYRDIIGWIKNVDSKFIAFLE